jgi:hypothetical protein
MPATNTAMIQSCWRARRHGKRKSRTIAPSHPLCPNTTPA